MRAVLGRLPADVNFFHNLNMNSEICIRCDDQKILVNDNNIKESGENILANF